MRPIQSFTLESPVSDGHGPPPQARLRHDNRPGPWVDAVALEAQFALEDGRYLLLLSDDSPYEECIGVLLLDGNLRLLDALEIGAPYTPGILSDCTVADGRLHFRFAGRTFILGVRRQPRRGLTGCGVPGVHRPGTPWRKRYLDIQSVSGSV